MLRATIPLLPVCRLRRWWWEQDLGPSSPALSPAVLLYPLPPHDERLAFTVSPKTHWNHAAGRLTPLHGCHHHCYAVVLWWLPRIKSKLLTRGTVCSPRPSPVAPLCCSPTVSAAPARCLQLTKPSLPQDLCTCSLCLAFSVPHLSLVGPFRSLRSQL